MPFFISSIASPFALFLLLVFAPLQLRPQSRPNILFIYTDDQAHWTVGAYGENPDTVTPNLDRLAAQGARIATAYASTPVCSPARVTLMTSRYSSETGVHDFITARNHKWYTPETGDVGLDPDAVTFPEILRDGGYATGLVGKFHVGEWVNDPERTYHPTNHGYDYFMGLTGGGISPRNPRLEEDGQLQTFKGDALCDDILTDRAIRYMEGHSDGPFLLSVHYRSPHGPYLPVAEDIWANFENKDITLPDYPRLIMDFVTTHMREYLASVAGVDRHVGELLDALDRLGLSKNTVVIFSSDHGYNMGHNGMWGKGNGVWCSPHGKPAPTRNIPRAICPNLNRNSLRVPGMIRWPGVVTPGMVIETPVGDVDWFPTVVEMAGLQVPEDTVIRGTSLVPILNGSAPDTGEGMVYGEYDMQTYARADMRSLNDGKWKLFVDFLNPWRSEFYDVQADPLMVNNLSGSADPGILRARSELSDRLLEKMEAHRDYLLDRAPGLVDPVGTD